jgi:hypothetical protein
MTHPVRLEVRFEVFTDEPGQCSGSVTVLSEGSVLVRKHGSVGAALAACRATIVDTLDSLIGLLREEDGEAPEPPR